MDRQQSASVPYIVHESDMCRAEHTIRRMQILCAILATITALTIAAAALGWI